MFYKVFGVFDLPHADPVVQKLPFLGSVWPVTLIVVTYLLFTLKIGKLFMEHRQPYNVKNIMIVYNLCQMIFNAILFSVCVYYVFVKSIYDFRCMETLTLDHPDKYVEQMFSYAFFINKMIDLLDTVFFVLRKSYKQITLLHVYHHAVVVFLSYCVARFYGVGGQFCMMATFNTFVHTVMYFYYLISASNLVLKSNLWWKKYITIIQLVQFTLMLIQSLWVLIFNPGCPFPHVLNYLQVIQAIVFLVMFSNFYIKAYVKTQQRKQQ